MESMKLKDLAKAVNELMKQGYGERDLLIAQDDEGNWYRRMYFDVAVVTKDDAKYYADCTDDDVDVENCIIIG